MSRTVREWRVTGEPLPHGLYPAYGFTWPRRGSDAVGEDPDDGEAAARAFWTRSVEGHPDGWAWARLEHRTVTYDDWDGAATHGDPP